MKKKTKVILIRCHYVVFIYFSCLNKY